MNNKRRLDGSRLAVIGASLALISVAIGLIGYFSIVRASDTTYEIALLKAERLSTIAEEMVKQEDSLRTSDEGISDETTAEAQALQKKFNQALDEFEQTSAYKDDEVVKEAYSASPPVSRYSAQYTNTLHTQATIGKLLTTCEQAYESSTESQSYDAATEQCRVAIDENTSVADKDYDERYYQPHRQYLKDSIEAGLSLSKAMETGDLAALTDASRQYETLDETEPELPQRITPDPRPDLSKLINTLQQRKQQLWR